MAATASAGYNLLNDLLPEVLQYVNGAPSIMLRIHLINAAIAFCNKTLILKKEPSVFQPEEDLHTYTLKYPQDRYRAVAVDEVKIGDNGQPLLRMTEHEMDTEIVDWRDQTSTMPTRYWLTDKINTIRLWPTPSADIDEDCVVRTIVTYKRDQVEIDDFMYEKWSEVIQAGALASVLMIPGATWYNESLARSMASAFRTGVREARKTTLSGTGKFSGRVNPQNYEVMGSNSVRRGLA